MLVSLEMKRALALVATGLLWTSGCFADAPSGTGGTGDPACIDGAVGCPCYPNETCDATLVCFEGASVCVPDTCDPLVAGCPCPAEGCGDGLVCEGLLCIPSTPSTSGSGATGSGMSAGTTTNPSTTSPDPITTTVDPDSTDDVPVTVTLYFSSSLTPFTSGFGEGPSRTTVQTLCETSMSTVNSSCAQSAAIFSAGDSDSVLDLPESVGMPFQVPVQNYLGDEVAISFQDLLTNGSAMSLENWEISLSDMPGEVPTFFWTGSNADGSSGGDCVGWTALGRLSGKGGQPALSEPEYWLTNNDYLCSEPAPVLCACWN